MFDCVQCYVVAQLTCTSETSIFTVQTVVVTNSIVGTVNESCLPAVAEQVIQKNGTSSLAILGTVEGSCTYKDNVILMLTLPDKLGR